MPLCCENIFAPLVERPKEERTDAVRPGAADSTDARKSASGS
jgi:hypothetical protein